MAAGTSTPVEAGQGPSVLGIAASIGAKIRDAAQDAKEQREKAAEKGETPKKGSLFKSALANQFNPIKSKKAKSNWAKQFDWNKTSKSDQQVKPPTGGGGGGEGKAKLKEFIAGGFTAILKDTGMMVSKLDGVKMMANENLSEVTRASSTLTVIKDSIDAQTELRRKALDEAKFARAEKKLEKTSDSAGVSDTKKPEDKKDGEGGGEDGGGGPFDWVMNLLGLGDFASNFIPDKWLQKLNPFKKSPVTQGGGGKPLGPRVPGTGPRVTTSGGAPAGGGMGGFKSILNPKNIFNGVKGLGIGLALDWGVNQISNAAGEAMTNKVSSDINALPPEKKAKAIQNLQSQLQKEKEWQSGAGGVFDKVITLGGLLGESSSEAKAGGIERLLGKIKMSEGGIVPSAVPPSPVSPMAKGGIAPGLYDNPTRGMLSPGQSVIPLNRSEGKAMFGKSAATNPAETAIDTVGAMILGVSAGMLGKTDSGTVGDQVKQNIRKASKEFGISNLTFTSAIGNAQFGKVDTKKDSKDFLMAIFSNMQPFGFGGGKSKGSGGGGGGDEKPPGADIENTQVKNEVDLAANTHKEVGFTSGFGPRNTGIAGASTYHRGQDIGTTGAKGYYVALKKTGKVIHNKAMDGGAGNWVGIDVGGGVEYRFMHLANQSPLKVGSPYNGETIGEIGNTGTSSGTHLHFEKLVNGNHVDPKADASALLSIGKGLERNYDPKAVAQPPVQTKPQGQDTGTRMQGAQASSAEPSVTQVAQSGIVGKPKQAFGGMFDWLTGSSKKKSDSAVNALRNQAKQGNLGGLAQGLDAKRRQQEEAMKMLRGMQGGGSMDSRRAHAERLRRQRASQQRSRLGVQKVNGKWVNMGVSDQAVGSNPWWQVWNKKGATAERKAKQEALAKNLAERLNKQEAAKLKPAKPSPARTPASGSGSRPRSSASSASASSTTAVIMPPTQPSGAAATAEGSFGSAIPSAKTSAMVFADFLYPDLV